MQTTLPTQGTPTLIPILVWQVLCPLSRPQPSFSFVALSLCLSLMLSHIRPFPHHFLISLLSQKLSLPWLGDTRPYQRG